MQHFFTIIGGMGTMATESYIRLLNQRTPANKDQDYLNYILVNHATVVDRTAYILDHQKPNPLPDLLEDIKQQSLLKPDFMVIICNTAHYFFEDLQAATDIPILHMPKEAIKALDAAYPHSKRVALLGTEGSLQAGIYADLIRESGREVVIPDTTLQAKVNELIYDDIKEKNIVDDQLYQSILNTCVKELTCDAIVLGCTELSLAQEFASDHDYPVIDAQSVIADVSLELALANRKNSK